VHSVVHRPRPNRGPTIIDVARTAGVSVSTVSRVVRDHPDVRAETRQAVQDAIDLLNYRPSPIARALVSGETRLLALLVSDITNPFYPQLAKSVEQEAGRDDYTVIICNTADRTSETRRYLERLLRQGLDGVIHASVARDENVVLSLLDDARRVVFTNRRPKSKSVSFVVSDNFGGAIQLTNHLLDQGHRRIGFIGGPPFARNYGERLEGFQQAMAMMPGTTACIAEGDFSTQSGARAVRAWIGSPNPPTAIIGVNDSVALGALSALNELNLRVPDDIALAGFDGVQATSVSLVGLTTVDQHIDELGRAAVRILIGQLRNTHFTPVQRVLAPNLLLRRSTNGAGQITPAVVQSLA
jgi:LacI family transcriptional regulator